MINRVTIKIGLVHAMIEQDPTLLCKTTEVKENFLKI